MATISSSTGLPGFPPGLDWSLFRYAIVESPARAEFLDLTSPAAVSELASFPRGVAFGEDHELRWMVRRDGFHVVLLSDTDSSIPSAMALDTLEPDEASQVLLWGRFSQEHGEFLDGRIPRSLPYPLISPLTDEERLTIRTRRYWFASDPAQAISRFVSVTKAPPPDSEDVL